MISEKTESRVSSRVEGIERQVVKQKGEGTAEKKMKMNGEGGKGEKKGGFVSLNP